MICGRGMGMTMISNAISKTRDTLSLIRFSHTIFALPFALASMLVAAQGLPSLKVTLLIIACMVTARTSAMCLNRYIDADIDAANPRTANRHIPQGILSRQYVLLLGIASGLLFIWLAYYLNRLAFALSPLALLIVWFYSYAKRFTHYAQLLLGLALAISPVGAWIAVTGRFDGPPWLLAAAVLFWVAGFDIFYATADYEFDKSHGIKSLVVRYGLPGSLRLARGFHLLTAIFLLAFGAFVPTPLPYYIGCLIVVGLLGYEHGLVKADDLSKVDQAFFTLNGWVGIVYLVATAVAVFS